MNQNTFQSKQFKENLHRYEVARKSGNIVYLEADELTDIAEFYHIHGRTKDALEAIEFALQIFPGAVEPTAFKARLALLVESNVELAKQYAEQIEDKHDLEYYYLRAEIMIADNRIDDAERYLESKIGQIDLDDMDDFRLDVATLFADYDAFDIAEEWLELCQDSSELDFQELRGRIEMSKGNYNACEKIFDKLIDSNPYCISYWNLLASTLYLKNEISKSLECSEFSLAINPDDTEAVLNKANCLAMLGNYVDALDCYRLCKKLQPQNESGEMGIAAVLMAQEKLDEALNHWKAAEATCHPQSVNLPDIYRNECLAYAMLGRFDEAFKCVAKLETVTSGSFTDILVLRGYLTLLAKDKEKAKEYFSLAYENCLEEEKDNTLWFISNCYFECNCMYEANNLLRKLTTSKNSKNFIDLWTYLVRTDYELGLQEEFLADLREATKHNPYGIQRELSDFFPKGMQVVDFYSYAVHHPITKKKK